MPQKIAGREEITKRVFEDFPEDLVPEEGWEVLYAFEDPDFGIVGVDGDNKMICCWDDGCVVSYDLDNVDPEKSRFGNWSLNTEQETIAYQQLGEEFMVGRDTSDWRWVHPRYRYLTDGAER